MTHEAWLQLIEERAPRLRAAGVQHVVTADGASFTLLPPVPVEAAHVEMPAGPPAESHLNALDDPELFGGKLPGYDLPVAHAQPLEGDA